MSTTISPTGHALDRLVPFGWRNTLVLNSSILIVLFFIYGFWWPYWRVADMDLWMVYEGMLLNERLPQEWFDHPGYLNVLLTGNWFWLWHKLGVLGPVTISALPPATDIAAFDAAWTAATRAGRVLSLILALGFINLFAVLLRRLVRDWRLAALAALLLTYSGGLAMHARIMRTELIAAGLTTISLLLLLCCARAQDSGLAGRHAWRPLLVGLGAFAGALALTNKVQAIFLIAGFPFVLLFFGQHIDAGRDFWRNSRHAMTLTAGYVVGAGIIVAFAAPLLWFGLTHVGESMFPWRPLLGGRYGIYQPVLALWVIAMVLAFARIWRVSAMETISTLAAVAAGIGLALLSLEIRYHPQNVLDVVNPIEELHHWAVRSDTALGQSSNILSGRLFQLLLYGFVQLLARKTFILQSSARPAIFLEWAVIAMMFLAWRAGRRQIVVQVAVLLGLCWLFDLSATLRGLKQEYFLFTDAIVIIAAVYLAAQVPQVWQHRWAYATTWALIIAHVLVSQSQPVQHSFKRDVPMDFCTPHMGYSKRLETYSYCLQQPKPPAT